jgi:transposase
MFIQSYPKKTKHTTYYQTYLVESYRNEDGKPRQRRLLNITKWPTEQQEALKTILKGGNIVNWDDISNLVAKDFGLPYAVLQTLKNLGLPDALGPQGTDHWPTIAAMIANRIDRPCAKYALKHWVPITALPSLLGQDGEDWFHEKACYAALDWLTTQQNHIEDRIYQRRGTPPTLFLYDLTSSYFEGSKAELAEFGYSRDHRPDRKQICIGLLGDMDGIPLSVEVFKGNTRDSTTVPSQIKKLKERFKAAGGVFVGDRGMVTAENKNLLKEAELDFILAITHRDVLALVEEHGPEQMGLFDEKNIADVLVDGRRLVVCRNPVAGGDTKRRRDELLGLSEAKLVRIGERVLGGSLKKAAAIQRCVDRWLPRWKTEKFFTVTVEDERFSWERNEAEIAAAARLDGVYVLESTLTTEAMSKESVQRVYKNLQAIERAFRCLKDELNVRPIRHWKESRIRGHVYMCSLAYAVEQAWRNALEGSGEGRLEWGEMLEVLRGWRRVSVPSNSRLVAKEANFTPETARVLGILGIGLP